MLFLSITSVRCALTLPFISSSEPPEIVDQRQSVYQLWHTYRTASIIFAVSYSSRNSTIFPFWIFQRSTFGVYSFTSGFVLPATATDHNYPIVFADKFLDREMNHLPVTGQFLKVLLNLAKAIPFPGEFNATTSIFRGAPPNAFIENRKQFRNCLLSVAFIHCIKFFKRC